MEAGPPWSAMESPAPTAEAGPPSTYPVDFERLPVVEGRRAFSAEWWLARGHLKAGSGELFVSLITALSILGVVLGVAVLDMVLGVMSGFEIDLRDKILGANAHVVVMKLGGGVEATEELLQQIEAIPGVDHASPFLYSEMMVRSRFGTSGVVFKGVDPERTGQVTEVLHQIQSGVGGKADTLDAQRAIFSSLSGTLTGGGPDGDQAFPAILVGNELAQDLQVEPGDVLQVINPLGSGPSMLGMPTPTVRSFRVSGIFHSGMFEYDTKWTYVSVAAAQDFLKQPGSVTGVEIRVTDIDDVEAVSRAIEAKLGYPFYARHWRNLNQALFEALALEKLVMGLILGLIIVVAGLLIISNLYMMVLTKRREIAILKAMGAGAGTVMRVFVMVGAVIGLVGATIGTALGYAGCLFLAWYEWPLETDVYYLSSLPVVFQPQNFIASAVMALLICLLATVYPAYRAASLHPVDGLRYE